MSTSPDLRAHQAQVREAAAAGSLLAFGATLSFVGGGSNKFWKVVWDDTDVHVRYGAHGSAGAGGIHHEPTRALAAKKTFGLLRSKTGKGYAVVDAAVWVVPQDARRHGFVTARWDALVRARAVNPLRLDAVPNARLSPRTPSLGGRLLEDLAGPHPDEETFMSATCVDASERFLLSAALSHPTCPDVARLMAALSPAAASR